jgi:hypothetical protein
LEAVTEIRAREGPQTMRRRIEQSAEDVRARDFEFAPKLGLRSPLCLIDWWQRKEKRAVGQIRPADHVLDAVEENRPRGLKQNLLVIRIEPPHGQAAATREPTERIREPKGHAGEIVERKDMSIVRCDHELPFVAGERPYGCYIGIDQRPEQLRENGFC